MISGCVLLINTVCRIAVRILRLPLIAPLVCVLSLTNLIRKMKQLKQSLKDKIVCFDCYDKEHKKLKIALVLCTISLEFTIISHFNWVTLAISLSISCAIPYIVPLVYKHIMPLIQPALLIPKHNLGIKNIPTVGDIMTFDCNKLPHKGVVLKVHGRESDSTRIKATIIHFPISGFFKTARVTQETIYLNHTEVHVLDFEGTPYSPAMKVVKKAKELIGKRNQNNDTYRSSRMFRCCKVNVL